MSTITDLKQKVQSLKDQLRAAENSLYNAQVAEQGLVINQTVLLYKGEEYLFAYLRMTDWAKPWAHGKKRKKSGEWGERDTCLYGDWSIKRWAKGQRHEKAKNDQTRAKD